MGRTFSHSSSKALLVALVTLVLGIIAAVDAVAHHPGSHARRQADGVVLEAVATATDGCTTIASVEPGAPAGVQAARNAAPVTVRLERPAGVPCTQVVTALQKTVLLALPAGTKTLMLYVVRPDGSLQASERVPVTSAP